MQNFFQQKGKKSSLRLASSLRTCQRLPNRTSVIVPLNANPSCELDRPAHAGAQQHLPLPASKGFQLYFQDTKVQAAALAPGAEVPPAGLYHLLILCEGNDMTTNNKILRVMEYLVSQTGTDQIKK